MNCYENIKTDNKKIKFLKYNCAPKYLYSNIL